MRNPTFGEVWERLENLRRGVEKDQRIIADLKFRKAEFERMLLHARWRIQFEKTSTQPLVEADGARKELERSIAELESEFEAAKGGGDDFSRGYDNGFEAALHVLKARR